MSHGHSHDGGDDHHGHSHGGGGGGGGGHKKSFLDREIGLDDDFDDDPALDKQWRGRSAGSGGVTDRMSVDPQSPFELLCANGQLAAVMVQWAQGIEIDRRALFQNVDATPLMWAALKGHLAVCKFLVHHGANPNYAMPDGQTPLMWTAAESRIEVGHFLLRSGADPTTVDERNYTAAMVAVQNDDLPFLHMLHTHTPVDPAQVDYENHTLLIWAAYRGQLAIAEYCVDVIGVDFRHADKTKRTALHWAAREGHAEVCAWLIKKGLSPNDKDDDGHTPLMWAEERKHREAVAILRAGATAIQPRAVGTVSKMASDRFFLLQALCGVVVVILGFLFTLWVPPFFSHWVVGAFLAKNVLYRFVHPRPINSQKNVALMTEIGVPRNLAQALRGLAVTRLREPMNLLGWMTFLFVQHVALELAGIPVPPLYYVWAALMAVTMFLTKQTALASVIPRGSLKDSPALKAVERREFETIHSRVYDVARHVRLPLRAFYCQEIDANVKRFDGWSLFLDAPIGEANHRYFFFFIVFALIHQATVFVWSWSHLSERVCPANHNANGFSLCSTLYAFVFHALPCTDLPAAGTASMTWLEWLRPTANNTAGVWLVQFGLISVLSIFGVFGRQYIAITQGVTRKELLEPFAPTTNGTMVSIHRGDRNIYSDGGPMGNLMLFVFGKQGERWRDLYAVPAPPTA